MKSFKELVSFYNLRFAYTDQRYISESPSKALKLSVIIPAFDENLESTLRSLESCFIENAEEVEVIVVLNHSESSSEEIKSKHQEEFQKWNGYQLKNKVLLHLITCFDLPVKKAGVGLARKIGMDESLKRFDLTGYNGFMVCLDADCEVAPNYLNSLLNADQKSINGASIYYEHPTDHLLDKSHKKAIVDYEIFLRYYSLGLKESGYPFFYQTVGSSMSCRASLYAKIGGMNTRKAGEDFYFLHKVFPLGKYEEWTDTTVFPSSRKSERVPFGTGKAMIAVEEGTKDYSKLYDPEIFIILKHFLEDLPHYYLEEGFVFSKNCLAFIIHEKLQEPLKDLRLRSKDLASFKRNFLFWFDGFKVLRFIHYFQNANFADIDQMQACTQLLRTKSSDSISLLKELRRLENRS